LKEAPPFILFCRPIEYIFADHFRHRTLCNLLSEIADEADLDQEKIEAVLHFLQTDFPTHVADEEEDLFPLLLHRATPEDGMDDVLTELSGDHVRNAKQARRIIRRLSDRLSVTVGAPPSADESNLLRQFAKHEKRHLTLENAIVLPLARVRLREDDHCHIGTHMASRRGLVYPEEGNAL
jgi:hemerythrin-like domain-containing protein